MANNTNSRRVISVILITYNHIQFLPNAVESILQQVGDFFV